MRHAERGCVAAISRLRRRAPADVRSASHDLKSLPLLLHPDQPPRSTPQLCAQCTSAGYIRIGYTRICSTMPADQVCPSYVAHAYTDTLAVASKLTSCLQKPLRATRSQRSVRPDVRHVDDAVVHIVPLLRSKPVQQDPLRCATCWHTAAQAQRRCVCVLAGALLTSSRPYAALGRPSLMLNSATTSHRCNIGLICARIVVLPGRAVCLQDARLEDRDAAAHHRM